MGYFEQFSDLVTLEKHFSVYYLREVFLLFYHVFFYFFEGIVKFLGMKDDVLGGED